MTPKSPFSANLMLFTKNAKNRPRARPGFVKPIQNGLRKVQNLIECRPSRAETGLAGRKDGIRFQKKEKTR